MSLSLRNICCSLAAFAVFCLPCAHAQYSAKETASALRWWCEAGRGHENGALCVRWAMTDAIASAHEDSEKVARVDRLKAAIQAGDVDGQAVDATNPERHLMMDAWCEDSSAEDASMKKAVCARVRNRKDFVGRRDVLIEWWCGEQGHHDSVKCKQMEFGKKVETTLSGPERKVRAGRPLHRVPILPPTPGSSVPAASPTNRASRPLRHRRSPWSSRPSNRPTPSR